jgi:hypothetical protein
VAEGGGLLNRYTAQKLYPGFESLPHRQLRIRFVGGAADSGFDRLTDARRFRHESLPHRQHYAEGLRPCRTTPSRSLVSLCVAADERFQLSSCRHGISRAESTTLPQCCGWSGNKLRQLRSVIAEPRQLKGGLRHLNATSGRDHVDRGRRFQTGRDADRHCKQPGSSDALAAVHSNALAGAKLADHVCHELSKGFKDSRHSEIGNRKVEKR